jgi:hypothetical protein
MFFWVLTPGSSETFRRFERTCHVTLQNHEASQLRNPLSFLPASASLLRGLCFQCEDEGHKLLRNIGLFHNHAALQSIFNILGFPEYICFFSEYRVSWQENI